MNSIFSYIAGYNGSKYEKLREYFGLKKAYKKKGKKKEKGNEHAEDL